MMVDYFIYPKGHKVQQPTKAYVPAWRHSRETLQQTIDAARQNVGTQENVYIGHYAQGRWIEDRRDVKM